MQRFKTGDRILIIPKFAHLYPDTSGVIISVIPDRFRPVFTEYTVLFADGSKGDLFEFQLFEDIPGYRLLIAKVAFHSEQDDERLILQAEAIDIDMNIRRSASHASIFGRVLERGTNQSINDVEVTLMKLSTPIITARTDNLGAFNFGRVFPGNATIQVLIPNQSLRIFGSFFV
jgi:hypothetical protein